MVSYNDNNLHWTTTLQQCVADHQPVIQVSKCSDSLENADLGKRANQNNPDNFIKILGLHACYRRI